MKPRLLDLFCGAGGAGAGYAAAGFDVLGVDTDPQPAYPFEFVQGDALTYLAEHGHEFAAVHASPPCQRFSTITPAAARAAHPDLIGPTRRLLEQLGRPYVIENVEGARSQLVEAVRLCGSSFGLAVRRHRYFESNVALWALPCRHAEQGVPVGVYGQHADEQQHLRPGTGTSRGRRARDLDEARAAMGMSWGTWHDLAEAIPPAFTSWLGASLLEQAAQRTP